MEKWLTKQAHKKRLVQRFLENFNKLGKNNITKGIVRSRIALLGSYWADFSSRHDQLLINCDSESMETLEYFTMDHYAEVECSYLEAMAEMNDLLDTFNNSNQTIDSEQNLSAQTQANVYHSESLLPRITIPKFHGSYTEWISFKDLFISIIDKNSRLTGAQKLHYLRASLTGEAALLLENIQISDDNYNPAWNILVSRYDNTRMLVHHQLRALFALSNMSSNSAGDLKMLLNGTQQAVKALETLKRPVEHWDDWLVYITSEKLSVNIRQDWEQHISENSELPTFSSLENFLINRIRILDAITSSKQPTKSNTKSARVPTRCTSLTTRTNKDKIPSRGKCSLCKALHLVMFCPSFREMTVNQRRSFVAAENLCFNCLRKDHNRTSCPSINRCQLCKKAHHTMLHTADQREDGESLGRNITAHVVNKKSTFKHRVNSDSNCKQIVLATAWVKVRHPKGNQLLLRALLDQGSEASFISESACQRLNLPRKKANISVSGIGASTAIPTKGSVNFELISCHNKDYFLAMEALVLNKLTNLLPARHLKVSNWPQLDYLQLADPTYFEPASIDLILGAEIYSNIMLPGIKRCPTSALLAQSTQLGWILSGVNNPSDDVTLTPSTIVNSHCSSLLQLEQQLRCFWETEEVSTQRLQTKDERYCEELFQKTYFRRCDGHYVVRLPTLINQEGSIGLGESRLVSVQRLLQMEKRFHGNQELKDSYHNFMREYLQLGHMEPVTTSEHASPPQNICYLPHHGVFKNNDPTSKLRVVFNASQKTSNGFSLNDRLHIGPKLQQDLWSIVTRWREHMIVFIADIEKMFRQVWVNDEDTNLQRIVWRDTPSEPIADFQLKTVTYGTASAPYLAIKTLHQLAQDEGSRYPTAAEVLIRDSYVDDILSGSTDLASTMSLKADLINLLRAGGFTLKKWATNYETLIDDISPDCRENGSALALESDTTVKTLGVLWYPSTDDFGFKVSLPSCPAVITKRNLLSDASRLFDPLGFLTPSTIIAKTMFQSLWTSGVDWDDPLPPTLAKQWVEFRKDLPGLECIRVPRWLCTNSSHISYELHGFADASSIAYAAVVYARITSEDGNIHLRLLTAKSKVAPLKTISIPRLELCAAVLLTRLLNKVRTALTYSHPVIFAWTDSSTVLAWLRAHPSRWKTYVASRVSEIQDFIPVTQWRYVPSESNPADCASRGLAPAVLPKFKSWWKGPQWLENHSTLWPTGIPSSSSTVDLEKRNVVAALVTQSDQMWTLLEGYSSLNKLLRITGYVRRFAFNCRQRTKECRLNTLLTFSELQAALSFWIQYIQQIEFLPEIRRLQGGSSLDKSSKLIRLNPFLDKGRILRVGGRLKNSLLTFDEKFPMILPRKNKLTTLLIAHAHAATLHGGTQQTLCYLRRRYWIIDGRNSVRQYIHRCVTCFRQAAVLKDQLMGSLPASRVRPSTPFQHTGVDYAGPILLKISKGRGYKTQKGYIAIFVCFSTKAVHIELVGDLTSEAFIGAFRRFTSRRGICTDLYSDRATNFIGADAELKTKLILARKCDTYRIPDTLASEGTTWHFIPAHSPHFGGIWEAAVKSVKHHLKRVIGETRLTFEEMSTLLSQVEAALNSRPLCRLNDDPNDFNSLTPGHFLIGGPITAIPEPSLLNLKESHLSRWQLTQKMYQDFWKRWSAEYLNNLQQRYKWTSSKPSVKAHDLVLLKDDRFPPCKWPLARVIAVHPGADGLVRVATVRYKGSTFQRPIVKMAVLPSPDDD